LIESFSNETIRVITETIFERYHEKLLTYPAAKSNHHSIRGGLLYHIKRMLKVGKSLAMIYDAVDQDLLYSGIILHDIEKINEMDADHLGVVSDYTSEGKLLGHLIMGIKTIDKIAEEKALDQEVSMMMQHMILSHHYEPEFGSPKKPMFLEAELLHHIDIIDARVYDFEEETEKLEVGGFSDPIWTLDRRRLYRSKYSNK
jgi:3'-5' exoribonuclease